MNNFEVHLLHRKFDVPLDRHQVAVPRLVQAPCFSLALMNNIHGEQAAEFLFNVIKPRQSGSHNVNDSY